MLQLLRRTGPKCLVVLMRNKGGLWFRVHTAKVPLAEDSYRYVTPKGEEKFYSLKSAVGSAVKSTHFGFAMMPIMYFHVDTMEQLVWPTKEDKKRRYPSAVGEALQAEALSVVFSAAEKRRYMNMITILSIALVVFAGIAGFLLLREFIPAGSSIIPPSPRSGLLYLLRRLF